MLTTRVFMLRSHVPTSESIPWVAYIYEICVYTCKHKVIELLYCHVERNIWRASVASETLTGVTQSKIGDVYKFICIYVWTYVCHFVL